MDLTEHYAFRMHPGQDFKAEIEKAVQLHHIKAGWVLTAVGSLTVYNLRFADQSSGTSGTGHFEIVSITGTLSTNGCHIHLCISDETGRTIGGHLLEGCKVYTTAEVVIAAIGKYEFTREHDDSTGYIELSIYEK